MGGHYVSVRPNVSLDFLDEDEQRMCEVVNSKVQRRLLPILFTAALMCYLDRTNLSFAALDMNTDLDFSERTYGVGAGVFFATYAAFGVPVSVLVKRTGARIGLPLVLLAWGIASGAMALINNKRDFYMLRLLVGAAESGFFPSVIYYLTQWFAEEDMGLSYTIVMTSTAVSGVVGGPLAGIIMTYMDGVLGIRSWRWLFIAEAVPTILLAIFMFFYLDREPCTARFLTREEREWLVDRQARELEARNGTHSVSGLGEAIRLKWLWLIVAVWLLYSCGYYGIIFWLPLLLKSVSNLSNVIVGFISTIPYLAAGLAMIFVARSSDRAKERRMHLAVAAFVSAIGFFGASAIHAFFGEVLPLLLICLSIAAAGVWAMFGPYWGIPTSILSGETAAAGFALINSTGVIGGYLGPFLVGELTLKTGSYDSSLFVFGLFMSTCGFLSMCLKPSIGALSPSQSATPLNPSGDPFKYSTETSPELESVVTHARTS
eukprot:TRINITY_DN153_c0_g1_i1.p1 TRINITY_DN153_c0_g1~~TRINITY_DN153_c0_g1_i1.p1  ORF type:complete len:488 (-),score=57.60 TRINITY_DN153_c0_g1_i1:1486-2949(-)